MNKSTVALTLVATWLLGACAANRASNLSDGQVMAVNSVVSKAEIDKARIAASRASDERVRNYAEQALAQHNEALNGNEALWTERGIEPVGSITQEDVSGNASNALDDLHDADANDFDAEYLDDQIEQHQRVATMIDSQLLPTASSPELKERLMQTRALIQRQLDDARALRADLATASR